MYPDTYEIGLPNQGLQILYEILNERPDALAERSYAPWTDLEEVLRREDIPLFSVDTHRSADEFDVIAFNLSAELVYTNVLNCIDLAGVPVRAADRTAEHPLIGAGGHATYNPEPLADFLDFVVLGDGEEVVSEINAAVAAWKAGGRTDRIDVLRALAGIEGVYVPSLYEPRYLPDGRLEVTAPIDPSAPAVVEKRTIADLADWPYPKQQLVPLTEVVHDRLNVEVFRGCTRGLPLLPGRDDHPTRAGAPGRAGGLDGAAGPAPHRLRRGRPHQPLDRRLLRASRTSSPRPWTIRWAAATCPSACRASGSTPSPSAWPRRSRRPAAPGSRSLPKAGTWRMRQVINKLITEEDLYSAVDSAFSQGWRRVKLYFLTGLPTETDEDTLGIIELARRCIELAKANGHNGSVTVSVGGFVPKAFTPFQWFGMNTEVELRRKVNMLRDAAKQAKGVQIKWHDPRASVVEGLVSRGDRRLGAVIEHVWRAGGTFQEWSEHFRLDLWEQAMEAAGLDMDWYCYRHRTEDEALPWDHLSAGLHKDFLWQDWRDALEELGLEDCRWTPCYDCGACTGYGIEHVVASAVPPAGGSQGTGQDLLRGGEVPVTLLARKPVGVGA